MILFKSGTCCQKKKIIIALADTAFMMNLRSSKEGRMTYMEVGK